MTFLVFHVEQPKDNTSLEIVRLDPSLKTYEERSSKLAGVLEELRQKDVFLTLRGWRNEVYLILKPLSFI